MADQFGGSSKGSQLLGFACLLDGQCGNRGLGLQVRHRGVTVQVDDRTDTPFGRRAVDWELKGVPVRVEVGPRDLESGTAMLVSRIPGGKEPVAVDEPGMIATSFPGFGALMKGLGADID